MFEANLAAYIAAAGLIMAAPGPANLQKPACFSESARIPSSGLARSFGRGMSRVSPQSRSSVTRNFRSAVSASSENAKHASNHVNAMNAGPIKMRNGESCSPRRIALAKVIVAQTNGMHHTARKASTTPPTRNVVETFEPCDEASMRVRMTA